jgi:hypothetical protein
MCRDEIGLCAQNIENVLGPVENVHNWEGLCGHSKKKENLPYDLL